MAANYTEDISSNRKEQTTTHSEEK